MNTRARRKAIEALFDYCTDTEARGAQERVGDRVMRALLILVALSCLSAGQCSQRPARDHLAALELCLADEGIRGLLDEQERISVWLEVAIEEGRGENLIRRVKEQSYATLREEVGRVAGYVDNQLLDALEEAWRSVQ